MFPARVDDAAHEASPMPSPIPEPRPRPSAWAEIDLGAVRVRAEIGTDPRYVAALMRALAEAGAAC